MRFTIVVLVVALVAACSGNGDSGQAGDGGTTTIDISLDDEPGEAGPISFFTPDEFTVAAGQEITFNVSNDGTVPHNMRIAGLDGEYNTNDDTFVEILWPGDTAVLKWTAPSEGQALIFRCDLHGNTGTITVQ